jgi:hypothetical protein
VDERPVTVTNLQTAAKYQTVSPLDGGHTAMQENLFTKPCEEPAAFVRPRGVRQAFIARLARAMAIRIVISL